MFDMRRAKSARAVDVDPYRLRVMTYDDARQLRRGDVFCRAELDETVTTAFIARAVVRMLGLQVPADAGRISVGHNNLLTSATISSRCSSAEPRAIGCGAYRTLGCGLSHDLSSNLFIPILASPPKHRTRSGLCCISTRAMWMMSAGNLALRSLPCRGLAFSHMILE